MDITYLLLLTPFVILAVVISVNKIEELFAKRDQDANEVDHDE